MPVQHGKLSPNETDITFANINSESASKADRIFHNGTDIIKCEFQTLRPDHGYHFLDASTSGIGPYTTPSEVPEYIDNDTSTIAPGTGGYHLAVEYPTTVKTSQIKFFSTSFYNLSLSKYEVVVYKDFGTVETQASLVKVTTTSDNYTFRSDLSPQQFEYTVNLSSEQEGRSWFITIIDKDNSGAPLFLNGVTEIVVVPITAPQIAYFRTDGDEAARFSMEKEDLLDMCYDSTNDNYYTIRFNGTGVGGADLDPDDDFTTVSGSTSFNPIRWTEDTNATSFLRSIANNNLVFATTAGTGRLTSNYVVSGTYSGTIDYAINSLTSDSSFFGLQAVEQDTGNVKYGVGVGARGGSSFYNISITSFSNNTTSAQLVNLRPDLETTPSGTETWTITYSGSNVWTVSGSSLGEQDTAATGEIYSTSGLAFQIAAASPQTPNDFFSFNVNYNSAPRAATSGTMGIYRAGNTYQGINVLGAVSRSIDSENDRIEIFGTTDSSVNLSADNLEVNPDEVASYLSVPVFTVEEVDDEGQVLQTIVEKLNVIKDPTKGYNDYIDGAVQIAVNGAQRMYVKVLTDIYTFLVSSPITGLVDEDTLGVELSLDVIPADQVYSFAHNNTQGGFLTYVDFDEGTSEVIVKTLTDTTTPTPSSEKVFLTVSDWEEQINNGTPNQFYWLSTDNDSLFYFRRHGSSAVNSTKESGTDGVANGTTLFVSSSSNFNSAEVKPGDLLIINESGYSGNDIYTIEQIVTDNNILVDRNISPAQSSLNFYIVSNAEQLQFNTDATKTAFAAVNVDDFTLRAGTADQTVVRAEIINAWGDPLSGKTVNFSVINGDGVVNPAQDTTDVNGEASVDYIVGTQPGPVEVEAEIVET